MCLRLHERHCCEVIGVTGVCITPPGGSSICSLTQTDRGVSGGGDSGGPWFRDTAAVGVHVGKRVSMRCLLPSGQHCTGQIRPSALITHLTRGANSALTFSLHFALVLIGLSMIVACNRPEHYDEISTYQPSEGRLDANIQGILVLHNSCLGLSQNGLFMPVVLPEGRFSFDGQVLTYQGQRVPLGSEFRSAGAILPPGQGVRMAASCRGFSEVFFVM